MLGGFGGTVASADLGAVLGGYGAVALTSAQLGSLLGAFGAQANTTFASLTKVAEAFGTSVLSATQVGSVLGGFGGSLSTNQAVTLGTLLGGFGTSTSSPSQLGSLLGGFGNTASSSLTALGQLLGGFGATLSGSQLGSLLGGFAASSELGRLASVTSVYLSELPGVDRAATLRGFADSLSATNLGSLLGGFVVIQNRLQLTAVLDGLSGQIPADVLSSLRVIVLDYADGRINAAQLGTRLADLAGKLSPAELGRVLGALSQNLDPLQLGQAVAGLTTTLQANAVGNLLSGFADSHDLAGLQALLSALRTTITTGQGDDVVSGVVLTRFQTGGGNDHLFAGTIDASFFLDAFADAGFTLPTAYAALAASGAELDGGLGNDSYYLIGEQLGHLTLTEPGVPGNDTSVDTLDLSGFGGGAVKLDLARTSEQTVNQGTLWLTIANAAGFENVVGTSQADTILGNARNNQFSGSDPLDNRATMPAPRVARTQYVFLDFDSETRGTEHVYTALERETIRSRMERYYRGPDSTKPWFDFRFVLNRPASGDYVTVLFNRTPDNEAAGGLSKEIDFRNLNLNTQVYVDVNGLLGGPQQPEATSDNFAAMSITIAAHEVGHSAGSRHFYASGPLGFGIHVPPGRDAYKPAYTGLVGALETTLHLMASPASVGSSLAQAVEELFFSEREAIVLAFAEQGVVVNELSGATQTSSGQPLGELPGLRVPNTIARGMNAHKDLAVAAIDVVGSIGINPGTGKSESDWYSFSGKAGDLINIEVMSASQTRYANNSIDAVLRVYDANRVKIAFNDDQFESSDAQIIDFRLPADGTYYVEVDTFHVGLPEFSSYAPPGFDLEAFVAANSNSDVVMDTDTGAYELFLYRFDAGNATDGGDVLDGRDGNDVLIGLSGNDVMTGGSGDDRFMFDDRANRDSDTVEGGTGRDRLDFSGRTAGIDINLAQIGSAKDIGGGQTLKLLREDIEDVIGTLANDQLLGNSLDNFLVGDPGNDPLRGGNDKIVGGAGADILIGHAGNDDITGGEGDDVLIGGYGSDRLVGSSGKDILFANELTGLAQKLRPVGYAGTDFSWWNNYDLLRALSLWWSGGFDPDTTMI